MPKIILNTLGLAALTAVILIATGLLGCSSAPASATVSAQPVALSVLQKNRGFSARLAALVVFNDSGASRSAPSEFSIPAVPINWMGKVFDGVIQNAGPLKDSTYQAHGVASSDGTWLDSVYFSREAAGGTPDTRSFFRITLRNIPILDSGLAAQPAFNKSGPDLQKYISKIEFTEGTSSFGSIDWSSTASTPAMNVVFIASAGSASQGSGMGR